MKKRAMVIIVLSFSILVCCFFIPAPVSPTEKIKSYYSQQLELLSQQMDILQQSIAQNLPEKTIQDNFFKARLSYKKIELLVEYYFEPDAPSFNGIATNFIEEEDPQADHEPQGFQVIETFIFPHIDQTKKEELQSYVQKLSLLVKGIHSNQHVLALDENVLDATMEELYRIISLGITGFDSPIAQLSLPEAKASLESVQLVLQSYKQEMIEKKVAGYDKAMQLLNNAKKYIDVHCRFDSFNRMEFITAFMNPLCVWFGKATVQMGYAGNQSRFTLIKKTGSLFDKKSLITTAYLNDDTVTNERIALGKKLFYDPNLSSNAQRSCAGCHQPNKGFTDGLPSALQLDGHTALPRNTPTLWNAALQKSLFDDSRQRSLNRLVIEVMSNSREMNTGPDKAVENIAHQKEYITLYRKAYPSSDTFMSGKNIANAIAIYVRTLISYNSRFDKYMRGEKDKMNAEEIKGFNLFMGKAKCATCHYAPMFNGSKPPTYYYQESEVLGAPANTDTLHPILDNDLGRYAILNKDFLKHAFKTPTLRNIALTAPYMHNGVYKTLDEVIEFYNKGGGKGLGLDVPNQTLPEQQLHLTKTEKKQLFQFLYTLTDTSSVNTAVIH